MSGRTIPAVPDRDRLNFTGRAIGVDREARVLRGFVVAQAGPFKSGRGEFDQQSLTQIADQINAQSLGVKSRFSHPNESNDGLGKHLGRARNARVDGDRVRADLHFDQTASSTPNGDLAGYVMSLAESDPEALSSSLVLRAKKELRLASDGTPAKGVGGKPLPPIWRPEKIHASDIVDTGDAVDGLLSFGVEVDGLPQALLWRATEMLDGFLAGQPRETVEARLLAYLGRYLDYRYGVEALTPLQLRVRVMELVGKHPAGGRF